MDWSTCLGIGGVASFKCIPLIISNVVNAAYAFVGVAAVIIIIIAAIKFIRSRGDATQIDEAKKTLTYGVIGLVVIFLAFFIVSLISTLTGVKQISP